MMVIENKNSKLLNVCLYFANILALPGPPKTVNVRNVGKDSLTVEWTPPDSDGGSRIKKYHIEQDKGSKKDWQKVRHIKKMYCIYIMSVQD